MNKKFTLVFLFCFSLSYSQKKELKLAQKLFKQEKVSESKETISTNSDLILNSGDSKIIKTCKRVPTMIVVSELVSKSNLNRLQKLPIDVIVCGKTQVNIQNYYPSYQKRELRLYF